jgi:SAM-dependent methyltransferase
VEVADLERLPYPDASFDRLVANMVLMLVPDPAVALRQARRVLTPGARLALTVWGRPEQSPMFTLPKLAAERIGHPEPEGKRSNFHLNDPARLRELLREAGFARVVTWHQTALLPVEDGADFAARVALAPGWREHFAGAPEALPAFQRELAALADARLSAGQPIAIEALGALARAV